MAILAAFLAGLAVWLLVPSARLSRATRETWSWRPALLGLAGLGGWGAVSGWLPVRAVVMAVAGGLVVAGGRLIWRRRQDRRVRAATAAGVLDACEVLVAELAAGRPPGHALAEAARRWSGLAPVVHAWQVGSDVPVALRRVAAAPGAGDLLVVAAAWQVAHHSGNGLADAVSRVISRIRAQRQTQRVVTSELASARATARLVAALPVVALGMGSGAGGNPWRFLLDTPVGWGCLAAGLAFGLAGLWWIEAIADQADPA
jgi:tight adherence protein B